MTKSDLIEKLSIKAKLPKKQAEMIVHLIFDSMIEAMRADDRIEIRGFGSFKVKEYKPYTGRNPKTGDQVQGRAKKLPFFKVGKALKERVDEIAQEKFAAEDRANISKSES
ncbi:MAG: HU family DNA-binding protein [Bdellovibrionota bacterium]